MHFSWEAKLIVPIALFVFLLLSFSIFTKVVKASEKSPNKKINRFVKMLQSENPEVRKKGADGLVAMGIEAKGAIPALIEALKDENLHVQVTANDALINMGTVSIPSLIKALNHQHSQVRAYAAIALGKIGPAAKEAIPALIDAMEKDEKFNLARDAVERIGPPLALVQNLLKHKKDHMRAAAALILVSYKPKPVEAVPDLIVALKDSNEEVRTFSARALRDIGPQAQKAAPALVEALNDENTNVRFFAASALSKVRPDPKKAVPALIENLTSADPDLRKAAAVAIGSMGPAAKSAKQPLEEQLVHEQPDIQRIFKEAIRKVSADE